MNIDLKLTPSELAYANKIFAKRDQYIRLWPWLRWFGIFMGITLIGIAVLAGHLIYRIILLFDNEFFVDATSPVTGNIFKMCMDNLMIQIYSSVFWFAIAVANVVIGLNILTAVIVFWRRNKMDIIYLKVARAIIATASTEPETIQQATTTESDNTAAGE